jgi:hypothetical protein
LASVLTCGFPGAVKVQVDDFADSTLRLIRSHLAASPRRSREGGNDELQPNKQIRRLVGGQSKLRQFDLPDNDAMTNSTGAS